MEKLSHGEMQVVKLMAVEGLSAREVAERVGRTPGSVESSATEILRKTGSRRMVQAVYTLIAAGDMDTVDVRSVRTGDETEHRLRCAACGAVTKVTHGESLELLRRLDRRYPSQNVIVECRCGEQQFVLQARAVR